MGNRAVRGLEQLNDRSSLSEQGLQARFYQGSSLKQTAIRDPSPEFRRIVRALVGKGHGIDALCFFLALTRTALLDLIMQLELPTPADLAFRRQRTPRAWTADDYAILLTGHRDGWKTAYIAERLGRSRAGVWAKARRLGLPKRNWRVLITPVDSDLASPTVGTPASDIAKVAADRRRLPARWTVAGADGPIELTSKRNGKEACWTTEALIELGMRKWGRQSNHAIAADFQMSLRAITSQLNWLEIPNQPRRDMREEFDRGLALKNIDAAGYKMVFCKSDTKYPYWTRRRAPTNAKRDIQAGFYSSIFA